MAELDVRVPQRLSRRILGLFSVIMAPALSMTLLSTPAHAVDRLLYVGAVYEIHPSYEGDYVLDVRGESRSSGAGVYAYRDNNQANQRWEVASAELDDQLRWVYTFRNLNSGLFLDVRNGDRDADLIQWRQGTGRNQQFYAIEGSIGGGGGVILQSRSEFQYVTYQGNGSRLVVRDGSVLTMAPQLFRFELVRFKA
ncbi:RICIN domain-containing protein [Streptomyces sp. CA-135486]|uniref:RICIN domain-containing protein n=1 Tax=Streptomyces sp. CA-135486 TaxID=3240049 RepID=UPI003D905DDB